MGAMAAEEEGLPAKADDRGAGDAALKEKTPEALVASLRAELAERLADLERRLCAAEQALASAGSLRVGEAVRIEGLDNVSHLHLNGKKAQLRSWEGPGGRWVVQVLQTGEMKSLRFKNLRALREAAVRDDGDQTAPGRTAWPSPATPGDGGGGLCIGDVVEICGLRREGQLNGARGEILGWDDEGGRWLVRMQKTEHRRRLRTVNLRRVGEAVRLPRGTAAAGSSAPGSRSPAQATDDVEPGLLVRLHGLTGAAELNGSLGRVQRQGEAGRWVVRVLGTEEGKGEEKSFRAENLAVVEGVGGEPEEGGLSSSSTALGEIPSEPRPQQAPKQDAAALAAGGVGVRAGQVVRIRGMPEGDEELNGLRGEALRWDPEQGGWLVTLLETGERRLVQPQHLAAVGAPLRRGRDAVIDGLEQAEALNGQTVRLQQWCGTDGRWHVRLAGGTERRLRPRRLRASPPGVPLPTVPSSSAGDAPPAACTPPSADGGAEVGSAQGAALGAVGRGGENDDEVLGGSSDEGEQAPAAEGCADVLREGAAVVVSGAPGVPSGQAGVLVRWEDVSGPFGQWVVSIKAPGALERYVTVNPAYLSLAAQ